MTIQYKTILECSNAELIDFCDKWIGKNYFSSDDINKIKSLSTSQSHCVSFVAVVDKEIIGVRFSFAPGSWIESFELRLSPKKWKTPKDEVGYFKSLFIAGNYQGHGLGKNLSEKSLEQMQRLGATAVVCHSWNESPNNSSRRYLEKIDFRPVAEYELYWHHVNYECTGCKQEKCICSATEMIKFL